MQGRWPQELRLREIATPAAANQWLREDVIPSFNRRFRVAAAQPGTAFVATTQDLDRVCSIQHERVVSNANTVQLGRRVLQLWPSPLRCHFVRCLVLVHEHLDETISVCLGPHVIGHFRADGAVRGMRISPSGARLGQAMRPAKSC